MELKMKHPLDDSGFLYDIPTIARCFRDHPHEYRSPDWWRPSRREPWGDHVYLNENGVMLRKSDDKPVYSLNTEVEIAVWRYLYEQAVEALHAG
jgi:hypothetical protein